MSKAPLTIGVHESGLARAQAEVAARHLVELGVPYSVHLEIVEDTTEEAVGLHQDHIAENRSRLGRLHRLLHDGEIDVVIHRGFDHGAPNSPRGRSVGLGPATPSIVRCRAIGN